VSGAGCRSFPGYIGVQVDEPCRSRRGFFFLVGQDTTSVVNTPRPRWRGRSGDLPGR
jgi:hypothetical protein